MLGKNVVLLISSLVIIVICMLRLMKIVSYNPKEDKTETVYIVEKILWNSEFEKIRSRLRRKNSKF